MRKNSNKKLVDTHIYCYSYYNLIHENKAAENQANLDPARRRDIPLDILI